jgi:hypothetical protein
MTSTQHLAHILAVDVADYSRMMDEDKLPCPAPAKVAQKPAIPQEECFFAVLSKCPDVKAKRVVRIFRISAQSSRPTQGQF